MHKCNLLSYISVGHIYNLDLYTFHIILVGAGSVQTELSFNAKHLQRDTNLKKGIKTGILNITFILLTRLLT